MIVISPNWPLAREAEIQVVKCGWLLVGSSLNQASKVMDVMGQHNIDRALPSNENGSALR